MKALVLALLLGAPDPDPNLVPFLPGTSHPEIQRAAPTDNEIRALRGRVLGLLQLPHPPGVRETREWANELQGALERRELGYIDAAHCVTRVRDTLSIRWLTRKIIRDCAEDLGHRFNDTPIHHSSRQRILRGVREVLSSAKNDLP